MRLLTLSLLSLCLAGCSYRLFEQKNPTGTIAPPPPQEFRAVWVATVANIDWPSKPGLPVAQQIAEMNAILDKAVDVNLNAVVLQIRTSADALYYSELEPWSEYLTGEQGKPPVPYYDPLAAWVDAAHKRGLELHAWLNPYRARHSGAKTPDAPNHLANTRPDLVKKFNGWEWLDPAEPEAREHTLRVVADVVRRYDIDGVHIDDYFYPYPDYLTDKTTKKVADFPDQPAWDKYQQSGGAQGGLSRADWRRDHVNRMVRDMYATIKATKKHVKFGISPFGIWKPGHPDTVKSGFNQYETLYADAKLWLNEGWCDYYTPQIYWKIDSPQPYVDLLKWWSTENTRNRHLWPGNFTSKAGTGERDWPASEFVDQVLATRANTPGYPGNVHFSMVAFLQNRDGLNDKLKAGPYAQPALVPPTPWLNTTGPNQRPGPAAPTIQVTEFPNGTLQLTWDHNDMQDPFRWAVYAKAGDQWHFNTFPSQVRTVPIRPQTDQPVTYITVVAVDRLGNPSLPRSIDLSRRTPCCPLKF